MATDIQELTTAAPRVYDHSLDEVCADETERAILLNQEDAFRAGLLLPRQNWLEGGLDAVLFAHERVESLNKHGVRKEAEMYKLRTMYDLTESGLALEGLLREIGYSTKSIGEWRIIRPWIRKLSVDELPQVINIIAAHRNLEKFPHALKMPAFGGTRPVVREEIIYKGDNANPHFSRALHIWAADNHMDVDGTFEWFADNYAPGGITYDTARGRRQFGNEETYLAMFQSTEYYANLARLSKARRAAALARMAARTAFHIAKQTDAA